MIGASFQPGIDKDRDPRMQGQSRAPGANQGVQEAIKVLSLRLPKVVGAQAVSPLIGGQGARGNPRVDSIVESVLAQMFPSGPAPSGQVASAAPSYQPQVEQFRNVLNTGAQRQSPAVDLTPSGMPTPNIIVGPSPPGTTPPPPSGMPPYGNPYTGTDGDLSRGGTGGQPPGMIAPLPDLRRFFDWLPQPDQGQPLI